MHSRIRVNKKALRRCYDYVKSLLVNVYTLLDPDVILSFLKPLVARKCDVLPNIFIEPF